MIIDTSKTYATTTRDYIAVKPDGKVVICRQNMLTGKVQEMPLTVDFDGNVRVYETMSKIVQAEPPREEA